jgi:hypothetical protein
MRANFGQFIFRRKSRIEPLAEEIVDEEVVGR